MKRKLISGLLSLWLVTAVGVAHAQTLDQEMPGLAAKIGKALAPKGLKNVAAIDFTDLQGQPNELGRCLAERLAVEMVSEEGISMMDRANIKSILAEHKLTEEGLVNPANAKKLGEFAGVDAILTGNVTTLDDGYELIVKAISTASAQIVAAGRIKFPKTSEIQQLFNRSVSGSAGNSGTPAVSAGERGGASYQDSAAIATKDIGSLRVVLKSVSPMTLKDQSGRSINGFRVSFDFVSRETQRPIVVALNANTGDNSGGYWGGTGPHCSTGNLGKGARMGDVVRTSLADDRGVLWNLFTSGVTGMGTVSVGKRSVSSESDVFSPNDIASVLRLQDDRRTNMTRDANCPEASPFAFVFGSTTQIAAGQSASVSMNFVQDAGGLPVGPPPRVFQMNSEIVVGVVTAGSKNSYSLYNLTFDRVSLPAF